MYLKRIEMNGFKSFAEPIGIDFQNGITCIVGPNGSGKSNISDAIRWVLGEQSAKTLRGGKMEEIIFSGTSTRRAKSMAEVTLLIDNSSKILPIDYTEVQLRRRLYRSGESEYSINGNQCRLRDIRELIMDTGIGVDGYSLIGQGKIAEIVSEKPEDRREIFEEAAGISKYRNKKAEAERKLDRSVNNRDRLNDIISEIELRLDPLKEESEKAKEYVVLRDRNRELEINIALKSIDNIHKKNGNIEEELRGTEEKLSELNEKKYALDESIRSTREKSEELERQKNSLQEELLKNVEASNELKSNAELNEERKRTAIKDKKRIEDELENIKLKLGEEKKNEEKLLIIVENEAEKLDLLKNTMDEKVEKTEKLNSEIGDITASISEKKNDIITVHREKTEKHSEITSIKNLNDTLEQRKVQIREDQKSNAENDRESGDLLENKKREMKNIEEERTKAEKNRAALQEEISHRQIRIDKLREEIESNQISIGQMHARQKTMEEMEANYEGYNNGVKYIMKTKPSGLSGIVAELLDVPSEYESAIEAALGQNMQNVIIRNIDAAGDAIELLRKDEAGKVTFLPLENLKNKGKRLGSDVADKAAVAEKVSGITDKEKKGGFLNSIKRLFGRGRAEESAATVSPVQTEHLGSEDMQDMDNEPGYVGYAIDKVRFDPKYTSAFEYLFGNTIIVDELKNASKVLKKYRCDNVVTLNGELIISGGPITGGSNKNKTAYGISRRSEIAHLGKRLKERQKENSKLSAEYENLENSINEDKKKRYELDERLKEFEITLTSVTTEIKNFSDKDEETAEKEKRWARELQNIEEEQQKSQDMINSLSTDIAALDIREGELEAEIAVEESQIQSLKSDAAAANEELADSRLTLGTAAGDAENNERMRKRIQDSIYDLERQIQEREKQLEEITEFQTGIHGEGIDPEAMLAEKNEQKQEIEKQIGEISALRESLIGAIEENSGAKEQLEEEVESLKTRKSDMDIKRAKQDTQVDGFKDRLWDEYEISYAEALDKRDPDFVMSTSQKENREIKARLKELGDVNVGAIKDYEETSERYEFYTSQRDDVDEAIESLQKIITETDKTIKSTFNRSFEIIQKNFTDTFERLFGGGRGELILEDPSDPLDSGIMINAQPPGKKLQNMNLLSGGEKTMTAIALMFAILRAKPTPFCILDEVEAALDDNNIKRFADYLEQIERTQFTLVTHQKATMEYADILYGVTMPEKGVSNVLSLKLGEKETEEFAKQLN